MEFVDEKDHGCCSVRLQSILIGSNIHDDTNHIDTHITNMNSSWKEGSSTSGGCGGDGKMSTTGKVSVTTGATAEITVNTRRIQPHPHESSFSSSLTTSRHHLLLETTNEYQPPPEHDEIDHPLPNKIPRFIYARTKTNTTVPLTNDTECPDDQGNSMIITSLTSSSSPPLRRTRSILPRFFLRRPHKSQQPDQNDDDPNEINKILSIVNDDSDNTSSDLLGGGMTLVSL